MVTVQKLGTMTLGRLFHDVKDELSERYAWRTLRYVWLSMTEVHNKYGVGVADPHPWNWALVDERWMLIDYDEIDTITSCQSRTHPHVSLCRRLLPAWGLQFWGTLFQKRLDAIDWCYKGCEGLSPTSF